VGLRGVLRGAEDIKNAGGPRDNPDWLLLVEKVDNEKNGDKNPWPSFRGNETVGPLSPTGRSYQKSRISF